MRHNIPNTTKGESKPAEFRNASSLNSIPFSDDCLYLRSDSYELLEKSSSNLKPRASSLPKHAKLISGTRKPINEKARMKALHDKALNFLQKLGN